LTPYRFIFVSEEADPPSKSLYWYVDSYIRASPFDFVVQKI